MGRPSSNICSAKRRQTDRQGYVLIMTLVLIVIGALSLAGLARRSLQLATEAIEAQESLQRRWGCTSLRQLLLERAEECFFQMEETHLQADLPCPFPSTLSGSVTLGRMEFRVRLSDEDAKLNLNTLQKRKPSHFRETLHRLTGNGLALRLQPDRRPEAEEQRNWYQSWGQVYDLASLFHTSELEPLLSATSEITCWGKGRVNVWRASDLLLETIITREVNGEAARKLLDARQEATTGELSDLLKPLALRRSQLLKIRSWLTDESSCYSLWVTIADAKRTWYHLWIKGDRTSAAGSPFIAFHW